MNKNIIAVLAVILLVTSCGNLRKQTTDESASMQPVGPVFCADSAYQYSKSQCDFGPRTMNSKAHDDCEQWIIAKFKEFGMDVIPQKAVLKGYDGTSLKSTNIIASYRPEFTDRILLCAHWDSRPWADNDPDEANHKTPVLAANDGASGVLFVSMLKTGVCLNGAQPTLMAIRGHLVHSIGLLICIRRDIRRVLESCLIW